MVELVLVDHDRTTEMFLTELRQLLAQAFGERFSETDWEHTLGGTHIAVRESGHLVSHAAVVPRRLYVGDEVYPCGYVEAVATLPAAQRLGYAALAMREANKIIETRFTIGALSTSTKDYYRKFGWEDWLGPSYVIENDAWIRSESEDRGIMVLSPNSILGFDFTSPIACERRAGDSW